MSKLRTLSGGEIITVGPGFVGLFAADSPPEGWLAMNGAEISRAVYSKLFSVIGTRYGVGDGVSTYNLPNAEDRFPRFAGGGLIVGEKQEDAIRNIEGRIGGYNAWCYDEGCIGCFAHGSKSEPKRTSVYEENLTYANSATVSFDSARVVPTANENRPKAIAFLACIKY